MGDSVQRVRGTVRRAVAAPPVPVAQSLHTPPPPRRQAPRQRCRAVGSPGVVPGVGAAMRGLHAAGRSAFVRPSSQSYSTLVVSSVSCIVEVAGGSDSTT